MDLRPGLTALVALTPALALAQATRAPVPAPKVQPGPALTRAEIESRLRDIPVFTITDAKGAPMLVNDPTAKKPISGVFINPAQAQKFMAGLKAAQPGKTADLRVTAVSLTEIFRLITQPSPAFLCQFVPDPVEVEAAKALQKPGQTIHVPLFMGRSRDAGGGLLTIKQNAAPPRAAAEIIPFYFSKRDLDGLIKQFSVRDPAFKSVNVDVVDLETFLVMLLNSPDKSLAKSLLIPCRDAVTYIQEQAKKKPAGGAPTKPG